MSDVFSMSDVQVRLFGLGLVLYLLPEQTQRTGGAIDESLVAGEKLRDEVQNVDDISDISRRPRQRTATFTKHLLPCSGFQALFSTLHMHSTSESVMRPIKVW